MVKKAEILKALRNVKDPELDQDIVTLNFISAIDIQGSHVTVHFQPDTLACPMLDWFSGEIKSAVSRLEGVADVEVLFEERTKKDFLDRGKLPFGGIEHLNHAQKVIAVMSGKGGVGKSLVTGLLAVQLRRAGYRVGVLDADITGPSIPKMFFESRPELKYTPRGILPAISQTGIKIMSVNFLLAKDDDAVIWRGPLIGRAIKQFWADALWGMLDFLIVDLPPGTSDAPLTVMQSLPMSGALLVTSPQDLAGMVVRKAASMANQIGIPLLGLVENMSYFTASDTGRQYEIFGPSHVNETAQALKTPVLARLPINGDISSLCDAGKVEQVHMPEFTAVSEWIENTAPDSQAPKML